MKNSKVRQCIKNVSIVFTMVFFAFCHQKPIEKFDVCTLLGMSKIQIEVLLADVNAKDTYFHKVGNKKKWNWECSFSLTPYEKFGVDISNYSEEFGEYLIYPDYFNLKFDINEKCNYVYVGFDNFFSHCPNYAAECINTTKKYFISRLRINRFEKYSYSSPDKYYNKYNNEHTDGQSYVTDLKRIEFFTTVHSRTETNNVYLTENTSSDTTNFYIEIMIK